MPLETETDLVEEVPEKSDLQDFLVGIYKKFDEVTFNTEKSSFIIQNLAIVLTIKSLEIRKGFFQDVFSKQIQPSNATIPEETFSHFFTNLNNFVRQYLDPIYESNNISYYIASNEENFSKLIAIFLSLFENFPKDSLKPDESIIESFIDSYLSYSKPKKDFSTLTISDNSYKFLLLHSLKQDLDKIYSDLTASINTGNLEQIDVIVSRLLNYRVLDPITFTGPLLIYVFTFIRDFYNKIHSFLNQSSKESADSIKEKLFGQSSSEIDTEEISRIVPMRHLFAIVPDKDFLLLTKLNLFLSMNENYQIQKPLKTNLHFNIIQGNILLGLPKYSEIETLNKLLQEEKNQELAKELDSFGSKYTDFILKMEYSSELKSLRDKLSNLIREEYLKQLSDLKIKSDLQERLAVVNPHVELFFLKNSQNTFFSLIIGTIPNRLRLTITMTKILIKQYYEKPEDIINAISLYFGKFIELTGETGKLAIFTNRNVLYHGEYADFRENILKTSEIRLLIDFGDYRYKRTKHGVALLIVERGKNSEENIFAGINLLSLEQEQKEKFLNDFKEDYVSDEIVILRKIQQSEFLGIIGFRFYIKKPSKWFTKFSAVPNTLHEYIGSIESGLKIGENKVLFLPDQKVKELQLEQTMLKNALKGRNFHRYSIPENQNLIIIPNEVTEEQMETEIPNTWKYLQEQKALLEARPQVKKGLIKWYQIADADLVTEQSIKPPKIILREKANEPIAVFDTRGTLQVSSALALRFNKLIKFRDYFKVLAWINSLIVKAGYQDLTQDTKTDAIFSRESLHNVTFPLALLKDDALASNIQQIVQMCFANKFSFNPHLLLLEYPEGQFHPEIYNFLFDKVYDVLIKKMKNLLDKTIKLDDIVIITINQANKKKKVEYNYLYPIIQDYAKSILVLTDGDLEITLKLKPRQAYTLPFLQLFLAYQPKDMIINYLKQYIKPESLEIILAGWPIPELQMKHVMETYNFVRFQRQNYINFFNRTKNMLIKVETMVAKHYDFTPEEIEELLHDKALIEA